MLASVFQNAPNGYYIVYFVNGEVNPCETSGAQAFSSFFSMMSGSQNKSSYHSSKEVAAAFLSMVA